LEDDRTRENRVIFRLILTLDPATGPMYSTKWLSIKRLNSMMPSDALSATLFAISDPTRRGLLGRLARSDATVGELAAPYDMSLAAISKHLKVLEGAGLISRGREAQWRPCHLEAAPLQAVADWAENYRESWERNLDSLGAYLKSIQRKPRRTKSK